MSAGRPIALGAIRVIQLYRSMVSPFRPPACRFIPTCSQYAVEALTEYGALRGTWLAVVRLVRCGPWHPGGWDPIPERPGQCGTSGDEHPGCPDETTASTDVDRGAAVARGESRTRV